LVIDSVDIIALPSGNALISWVEKTPGGAEVHARIIAPDGAKKPAMAIAESSTG
jgi:hypothetical protein